MAIPLKPGDIYLNTDDNTYHTVDTSGIPVKVGGTGASPFSSGVFYSPHVPLTTTSAHTHSIGTSAIPNKFTLNTAYGRMENTFTFRDNITDESISMKEKDIFRIAREDRELTALRAEQPAVQEAYEQLQLLIKLYRE